MIKYMSIKCVIKYFGWTQCNLTQSILASTRHLWHTKKRPKRKKTNFMFATNTTTCRSLLYAIPAIVRRSTIRQHPQPHRIVLYLPHFKSSPFSWSVENMCSAQLNVWLVFLSMPSAMMVFVPLPHGMHCQPHFAFGSHAKQQYSQWRPHTQLPPPPPTPKRKC